MKLSKTFKSVLASVLAAGLFFSIVGDLAPVRSWAADITVTAGSSASTVINNLDTVTSNFWDPVAGSPSWATMSLTHDNGDNTANFTLTANPGSGVTPGSYSITFQERGDASQTVTVTILVNAPGTGSPDPSTPGSGLPEFGPDGHHHAWEGINGGYRCSVCGAVIKVVPAHDHQYEWVEGRPATETEDGEIVYACKICGDIKYREGASAYTKFCINTQNKIKKASFGSTVNIETYRWLSFPAFVLDELAARPDVTLNLKFREKGYKGGEVRTVTIPAGYDVASLKDANGYAGFLYLAGVLGSN